MAVKVLTFSGSVRDGSWNQKLAVAGAEMARGKGADVTMLNLGDLDLPMFNEDLEKQQGHGDGVKRLKSLMIEHHAFLIACPEYNSSITPLLKNAIDWASRPAEGETPLQCYRGKVVGLLAASPGGLGGLRGLVTVRSILGNIGAHVCPTQHALSAAHEAFDDSGSLKREGEASKVEAVVDEMLNVADGLNA